MDQPLDRAGLTAADDSHVAGLVDLLQRYDVGQVIQLAWPAKPTAAFLKWQNLVSQKQIASQTAQSGLLIELDCDVSLDIMHAWDNFTMPQNAIVRVRSNGVTFLIADGATEGDQAAFLDHETDPAATVLVAPRKPTQEFVTAVGPTYAVFFGGSRTRAAPSADAIAVLQPATI